MEGNSDLLGSILLSLIFFDLEKSFEMRQSKIYSDYSRGKNG